MKNFNLKSKSRPSSSSSGSDKILKNQKIQEIVSRKFQRKDLFDKLLDQSSMVPEESESYLSINRTIQQLNLSPRQHTNQQGCKCVKISCLKLYCECFSKGKLCNSNCICVCCHNTAGNQEQITQAKSMVNYRQPGYFSGVPQYIPTRKCTCKKSLCRKKYCECYNNGLKCTQYCECVNCHNSKPQIHIGFDSRIEIKVANV